MAKRGRSRQQRAELRSELSQADGTLQPTDTFAGLTQATKRHKLSSKSQQPQNQFPKTNQHHSIISSSKFNNTALRETTSSPSIENPSQQSSLKDSLKLSLESSVAKEVVGSGSGPIALRHQQVIKTSKRELLSKMFAAVDDFLMLSRTRNQYRVSFPRLQAIVERETGRQFKIIHLYILNLILPDAFSVNHYEGTVLIQLGIAGRSDSSDATDNLPSSVLQADREQLRKTLFKQHLASCNLNDIRVKAALTLKENTPDGALKSQLANQTKIESTKTMQSKKRALEVSQSLAKSTPKSAEPSKVSSKKLRGLSTSLLEKIQQRHNLVKALEPEAQLARERRAMIEQLPGFFNCIVMFLASKKKNVVLLDILKKQLVKQYSDRGSKQQRKADEMLGIVTNAIPEWCSIESSTVNSDMKLFKVKVDISEAPKWSKILVSRAKLSGQQ